MILYRAGYNLFSKRFSPFANPRLPSLVKCVHTHGTRVHGSSFPVDLWFSRPAAFRDSPKCKGQRQRPALCTHAWMEDQGSDLVVHAYSLLLVQPWKACMNYYMVPFGSNINPDLSPVSTRPQHAYKPSVSAVGLSTVVGGGGCVLQAGLEAGAREKQPWSPTAAYCSTYRRRSTPHDPTLAKGTLRSLWKTIQPMVMVTAPWLSLWVQ